MWATLGFPNLSLSFPEPDVFSYSQHARLWQICSPSLPCSKIINRNLRSVETSRSGLSHTPCSACVTKKAVAPGSPRPYLSWWRPGICCAGKALGSWWCSCGTMKLFWCRKWTSPRDILGKEERPHVSRGAWRIPFEMYNKLRNIHLPQSHVLPASPAHVHSRSKTMTRKGTWTSQTSS